MGLPRCQQAEAVQKAVESVSLMTRAYKQVRVNRRTYLYLVIRLVARTHDRTTDQPYPLRKRPWPSDEMGALDTLQYRGSNSIRHRIMATLKTGHCFEWLINVKLKEFCIGLHFPLSINLDSNYHSHHYSRVYGVPL